MSRFSQLDLLRKLAKAELEYAHFNAQRTSAPATGKGIELTSIGGIPCLFEPGKPGSEYYNRAVLPPDIDDAEIESALKELPDSIQGVEILIPQQTEATVKLLQEAGFVPGNSLCYLVASPAEKSQIQNRVDRLMPDQTDHFFDLLELSGADFSKEKRELKQKFYCTGQFRCFVTYSESGEPTGWATSFISDDSAFFANAFTLPEFRRKGFHETLLKARLNDVIDLGIKHTFTDVEPTSQSHQNCERSAFRLLTVNQIWKRKETS